MSGDHRGEPRLEAVYLVQNTADYDQHGHPYPAHQLFFF